MWGKTRKVSIYGAAFLALSVAGSAFAADVAPVYTKAPPPPAPTPVFDVAIGGVVMTDYNFRGVSQSNRRPSGGAYFEGQYNGAFGQAYLGLAGLAISWPSSPAYGFTDPSAEIDIYGGFRKTWGQFTADLGAIYYYYPGEQFNGFTSDSDFWEVYWKGSYAVTDKYTVGVNVFYTPDLLNYSESFGGGPDADAFYASLTAKYILPWTSGSWGSYVSGELGHWWIDKSGFGYDPDYTYWNAGIAFTYKAITFDLRYHGTDMSRGDCANFLLVGTANPASRWCKDAFIASLKFDTTLNALK